MSNVNNWAFSRQLESFKTKILDTQKKKIADAESIMIDSNHQWKDEAQKTAARKQLDIYKAWLTVYQVHYDEGLKLCIQHEQLVNNLSKWYDCWYENISNNGKQETEMMNAQADMLQEIFVSIYKELQPLKLDGMKTPQALNMK